jgi:hypothetical protein
MAVHEWASGEIAAALTLTSTAADRELSFADTVVTRLPQVFAALSAGLIDRPKAWVFADHLDDLIAEQIAAICSVLVPMAPRLTTGRLRARLVRMIQEIDPEHARRRYQKAVRERCVVGYLDRDGTATINASGLPVDEAAAACERLELLGETVKRAGHPGRLAQIQTDLFLGMLDGRFHGLTEKQIVTELLARSREDRPCPAPLVPDPADSADSGTDSTGSEASGGDTAGRGTCCTDASGGEAWGAAGLPASPTRTTRTTTPEAGPPPAATSVPGATATTSTSTRAAGAWASPSQGTSSGPARSDAPTARGALRSRLRSWRRVRRRRIRAGLPTSRPAASPRMVRS